VPSARLCSVVDVRLLRLFFAFVSLVLQYKATIGADFLTKEIMIDDKVRNSPDCAVCGTEGLRDCASAQ
jgi:hypothetical protein